MPIYRGPDGKIIEERTVKTNSGDDADRTVTLPTDSLIHNDDDKTRKLSPSPDPALTPAREPDAAPAVLETYTGSEEKTRLLKVARRKEEPLETEVSDAMSDPAVGWLAVVDGPGKGHTLRLGYGANSIGRSASDRVSLPFGDDQISRHGHATVVYDPRGRKFYIQPGGGSNLTYLGGEPVLAPRELHAGEKIQLGDTTLYFHPLCGENFDWQDTES